MPLASALRREPGVDAYRGLAVILMYVVHARRLQPSRAWEGSERIAEAGLSWLMWSEPYIAASFLFIVGFSLVLSRERTEDRHGWLRRLLLRALGLYGLAALLFLPHYGLAFPDLLLSPGILSAIAVAVAAVGAGLATSRPARATVALAVGGLLVAGTLEGFDLSVSGLNAGPGGVVPLISFTAAGALLALSYRTWGRRVLDVVTGAAIVPLALVVLVGSPWTSLHGSLHPDYGGEVALAEIFTIPRAEVRLLFWNHTVAGCLGLLLPLCLTLRVLVTVGPWLKRSPWSWVGLIGRHALLAYVGHLVVLGVLELSDLGPRTPWQTWGLVAALAATAAGAGAGLEAWKRRPTSKPDRASVLGADSRR
jgi:hypothetical protein